MNGWFAHYRCLQYRASSDKKRSRDCCKAWIKIRNSDGVVLTSVETHENCDEAVKRSRITDISLPVVNGVILDLTAEMLSLCKDRAMNNTISAKVIADSLADEYDLKYAGRLATFLSRLQLRKAVYSARSEEFGDSFVAIKSNPLVFASDDDTRHFSASIYLLPSMIQFKE